MKRLAERIDVGSVAIVALTTAVLVSLISPPPWSVFAGCAALAAVLTSAVIRVAWPIDPKAEPTAGQVFAAVRDMREGLREAGFSDDEAGELVRERMRSEFKGQSKPTEASA